MQHSIINIGKNYEELSKSRKDKKRFNSKDFFEFAKQNIEKYHLIESSDDLLVVTWYSNDLIEDYRKSIIKKN